MANTFGRPPAYSHVQPRFRPGESGPYGDAVGSQDYRQPLPRPRPSGPLDDDLGLAQPDSFFHAMSEAFGRNLTSQEAAAMRAILRHGKAIPLPDLAYALATADHETDRFRSMSEYGGGKGYAYGRLGPDGQVAAGAGFAQLTGHDNFKRFDDDLGLGGALVNNYALAKDPDISARILIEGLTSDQGFTGAGGTRRYFGDHDAADEGQFRSARRIVNGPKEDPNVAAKIARQAVAYQSALQAGGYNARTQGQD